MKINLKLNMKSIKLNKKKTLRIGSIGLGVVILSAIVFFVLNTFFGNKLSKEKVYVDSVKTLVSLGDVSGAMNRYAGVVEPQDTWNIQKNSDKKVKEIFVQEGQSVEKGTKLFSYDVEDIQMNLEQARLEVERIQNDITSMQNQVNTLQQESAKANADERLDYTIQIQSTQASIKKSEYELRSKSAEVTKLEQSISNAVVESKMKGVVQKINSDDNADDASSSDSNVLMSILATGEYRVKGTISEQNVYTIEAGAKVIVRSRTDDKAMWKGTLQAVDTGKPVSKSSDDMGSTDNATKSSNYPFYVQLSSSDGLILGQHVYIEPDVGQADQRDGLWLPSYYFASEGTQRYVWIANEKGLLQKRNVTVGEYDDSQDTYEIVSGLTEKDYIAFPSSDLQEGMGTTKNIDEATVGGNDTENSLEDISDEEGLDNEDLSDEGVIEGDTSSIDNEVIDDEILDDTGLDTSSSENVISDTGGNELSSEEIQTEEIIDGEDSDINAPDDSE
ncbi:MAG: efflux RND transporter periplasmic adaptor subunit [Lachnospiraceae bacterium]